MGGGRAPSKDPSNPHRSPLAGLLQKIPATGEGVPWYRGDAEGTLRGGCHHEGGHFVGQGLGLEARRHPVPEAHRQLWAMALLPLIFKGVIFGNTINPDYQGPRFLFSINKHS